MRHHGHRARTLPALGSRNAAVAHQETAQSHARSVNPQAFETHRRSAAARGTEDNPYGVPHC